MQDSNEGKSTRDVQLTIREALGSKKEASRKESEAGFHESLDNSDEDEAGFDARMRQQILKRRKELGDPPPKQKLLRGKNIYSNTKTKTTFAAHNVVSLCLFYDNSSPSIFFKYLANSKAFCGAPTYAFIAVSSFV